MNDDMESVVAKAIEDGDSYHDYKPYKTYAKSAIEAVYNYLLDEENKSGRDLKASDIFRILKDEIEK